MCLSGRRPRIPYLLRERYCPGTALLVRDSDLGRATIGDSGITVRKANLHLEHRHYLAIKTPGVLAVQGRRAIL